MAKVYVVLNGRKNGIFNSWDECQKSILKFKDAAYKSFVSTAEAEEFYRRNMPMDPEDFKLDRGMAKIDVAGSYDEKQDKYGFAYDVRMADQIISGSGIEPMPLVYGQQEQTGEIEAVVHAVKKARELGLYSVLICYTHAGTGAWAIGTWNTKKDGPVYYKKGIDECIMDVRFAPVADNIPEMKEVIKKAKDVLYTK